MLLAWEGSRVGRRGTSQLGLGACTRWGTALAPLHNVVCVVWALAFHWVWLQRGGGGCLQGARGGCSEPC